MRKIFLYMTITLDGFIAGPHDELDWMLSTPTRSSTTTSSPCCAHPTAASSATQSPRA